MTEQSRHQHSPGSAIAPNLSPEERERRYQERAKHGTTVAALAALARVDKNDPQSCLAFIERMEHLLPRIAEQERFEEE
jgi:hypothetical protein